jgi:hypothetical protein
MKMKMKMRGYESNLDRRTYSYMRVTAVFPGVCHAVKLASFYSWSCYKIDVVFCKEREKKLKAGSTIYLRWEVAKNISSHLHHSCLDVAGGVISWVQS